MRVFISSIQAELGPQSIRPEVIKRRESHLEDYGSMTEAERNNLLGTDSFILDPQVIHEHEVVVAIDDIKITGTHEKRMRGVFQNNGILNDIVYTTYAELVSTDVHPRFESYINEFSIQTLADLQSILSDPMDQFILNTRVAKLMLKQPFEQFKVFIRRQSEQFCRDLLDGAIGSGYESEPLLAVNLAYLRDFVQTSSLIDA